ncbi:MAG: transporter substrate-binding protein [Frankiales bacterium]|nr:transporter substrate-binding protein [Frankiales bacterium]
MRKSMRMGLLGTALLSTALAAACGSSGDTASTAAGSSDKKVNLTLGHAFPADHLTMDVLTPWTKSVSEATGGTVTIDVQGAGALGAGTVVYENVVSGAQDLGMAIQGYTPGKFPLTEAVDLPFRFTRAEQATRTLWDAYEQFPELAAEYKQTKVLALWATDVGDIFTAKKQVKTMEDMKGLTLRGPGATQNRLIEELGGKGVVMPAADVVDSVDRGVIGGLMVAGSGPKSLGMAKSLDYGLRCACYTTALFLTMNQKEWDGLSDAQRAAIDKTAGRELSIKLAKRFDAAYDGGIAALVEGGATMTVLEGEERKRWEAVGDKVIQEWVTARKAAGPSQKLVDFVKTKSREYAAK